MHKATPHNELTRAISIARQSLTSAFGYFVTGDRTSVTFLDDVRDVREALALLEYLGEVARILHPFIEVVPELQDTFLPWWQREPGNVPLSAETNHRRYNTGQSKSVLLRDITQEDFLDFRILIACLI